MNHSIRLVSASMLAFLLAACAVVPPAPPVLAGNVTTVGFDGEWIVYRGDFTADANTEAQRLLEQHPGARGLRVMSNGGSITHGIALGEWLAASGRDVYIDELCFSSCANYVFPAGRRKLLSRHATLGWHGGTRQWDDATAMCRLQTGAVRQDAVAFADCLVTAEALRQRETQLYEQLGVDPGIMVFGFLPGANYPALPTDIAWTYSLDDLAQFGLVGITVDGRRWTPRFELDGQTVCLMDLEQGRCGTPRQR